MTNQKPTTISSAERDMMDGGTLFLDKLQAIRSGVIYRVFGKSLHDSKQSTESVFMFFSPPKTEHNTILPNIAVVTVTNSAGILDSSNVETSFTTFAKSAPIEEIYISISNLIQQLKSPIISEVEIGDFDSTIKKMDFNFQSVYDSFLFFTNKKS